MSNIHLHQLNILFATANRHFGLQKLIESLKGNNSKTFQLICNYILENTNR